MNATSSPSAEDLLELFPPGSTIDASGELCLGGSRASDLAAAFGTPALIIDEVALRQRVRAYVDGLASRWPNSQVVWASKSLPHTAVYRVIREEGAAVDVSGEGELIMALAAGFDPAAILLHGNAKTDDEIAMAIKAGVGTIVVDNFDDIDRLERLATTEQAVLVRVVPGVEADTHAANATGHHRSKFGLSMDDARTAIKRVQASDSLRMDGLHIHIGSQIMETEPFTQAIDAITDLGRFAVYNLGGGLGARYTYADHPASIDGYLDALVGRAAAVLHRTPASSSSQGGRSSPRPGSRCTGWSP